MQAIGIIALSLGLILFVIIAHYLKRPIVKRTPYISEGLIMPIFGIMIIGVILLFIASIKSGVIALLIVLALFIIPIRSKRDRF